VPASSWLPFGAAEATDQPQWMSITLAYPRPPLRALPKAGRLWVAQQLLTPAAPETASCKRPGAPGVWLGAPVVGLCSAVSYSPTPWRVQYHRRWRA
jgi:hypothetical protein